jgi:hypothetical protein
VNPLDAINPCRALEAATNPFALWPGIAGACAGILLAMAAALWLGRKTTARPSSGRILAIISLVGGLWALVLTAWSANEARTYSFGCVEYVQSAPIDQSSALDVTALAVLGTALITLVLLVVGVVVLRARQKTVRLP